MSTSLHIAERACSGGDSESQIEYMIDELVNAAVAAAMAQQREEDAELAEDSWTDVASVGTCSLAARMIRNSPLTTTEAQTWLEQHDAAIRATAYRRCADILTGTNLQTDQSAASMFASWATEADAQASEGKTK